MRTDAPAASGPQPWHSAPAWARVRPGLSEAEVVAILGPPTAGRIPVLREKIRLLNERVGFFFPKEARSLNESRDFASEWARFPKNKLTQ